MIRKEDDVDGRERVISAEEGWAHVLYMQPVVKDLIEYYLPLNVIKIG